MRFIHASPDAENVDVLLDEGTVFTNVAFSEWTEYIEVPTGTHTVTLRLTTLGTPILSDTVPITETDYTLAAAGTWAAGGRDFELLRLIDDNSAPDPNMARGRFVHLVPDAPPVSIAIDGDLLDEDVSYGDATDYATVASGSHAVQISALGQQRTVTATVGPNNVYSFFALGQLLGTPALDVQQVIDESYNHPIWLPLVTRGG